MFSTFPLARPVGAALGAAVLGAAFLVPAVAQSVPPVAIDNTGPQATKLVVILAVLVLVLFAARRIDVGQLVSAVLKWGLIFAVLIVGYTYWGPLQSAGRNVVSVLVPGMPMTNGESVTVHRAFQGHFVLNGDVGGTPVSFLFDTGASTVVLTAADAARAGFDERRLDFRIPVMTAAGLTTVAPVRLSSLSIGGITVNDVRAAVAKPGDLDASLLGLTFLNRLDGYEVRRDRLVLNPA